MHNGAIVRNNDAIVKNVWHNDAIMLSLHLCNIIVWGSRWSPFHWNGADLRKSDCLLAWMIWGLGMSDEH